MSRPDPPSPPPPRPPSGPLQSGLPAPTGPARPPVTAGHLISGIVGGALIYGLSAGLASGIGSWIWASGRGGETSSEAPTWFVLGLVSGGLFFAMVGAAVGLVQRLSGWWLRWPWVSPVIGLLLGAFAGATAPNEPLALPFAFLGLVTGTVIHGLFAAVIVRDRTFAPKVGSLRWLLGSEEAEHGAS